MYQSIIKKAEVSYLRWKDGENKKAYQGQKTTPSLWPSSLFSCKRKTAYQVLGEETTLGYSDSSLNYMNGGNIYEDATAEALEHMFPNVHRNVSLKNDIWSGKADFIIDHLQRSAIIVERKVTGENKFKDDKQLPKKEHVGQLALYGRLYEELFGIRPKMILYITGWGCWSELEIEPSENRVYVHGIISNYSGDTYVSKHMRISLEREIEALEATYKNVLNGGKLPPRLDKKYKGCEFMGRPSCPFYYNCWGK